MKKTLSFSFVLALGFLATSATALAASLCAVFARAESAKLPDTPGGRRVAAYIEAFNSGEEQRMREFTLANLEASSLARRPMDERLSIYRRMRGDMGTVELARVLDVKSEAITVVVRTSKNEWFELGFELEAGPEQKLRAIRVQNTEAPGLETAPADRDTASPSTPADSRARLIAFAGRVASFGFTGALLATKDDSVLLERGFGMADKARAIPITADTVFSIGSNTKDFTAVAILQLEARGKLSLNDAIGKYFPNPPADKAGITIQHLLVHRAGLESDYGSGDAEPVSREELVGRVFRAKLRTPPGAEFHYSNAGYSLLTAILESVSGQSYEQYFAQNIFKPAGMQRTGFALLQWKPGEVAHGYKDGKDWGTILERPHASDGPYWNLRGNGGIHSTLRDMMAFYRALWSDSLLPRAQREKKFPSDQPIALAGSNLVFFFIYIYEPQDRVAVIAASTDADMPAQRVARDATRIARGQDVPLPRSAAEFFSRSGERGAIIAR